MCIFAPDGAANLSAPICTNTMAVIRNTASAMANGRIGNTTYYVANGQQIARQSKNNSNYGAGASRSDAQQLRRVRWANLVNAYKAMSSWMPKAFESKKQNQSDYNKFMQLNINTSTVALTKDMAANGCAVWQSWQVSQGSLVPINLIADSLAIGVASDIKLSAAISGSTTIAALSADIIANNPAFRDGDNIAQVLFYTALDSRGYPYSTCRYYEFTLNTSNTALLSTLPVAAVMGSSNLSSQELLAAKQTASEVTTAEGFVWIHTRKVEGKLMVSSQSIYMQESEFEDQFSTQAAIDAAIASYGVEVDVPLDPSFSRASVRSAYVNGSLVTADLESFPSYTGNVTLEISVNGWDDDSCYLMFGDVRYTPLATEGNKRTYIIGDNGSVKIYINNVLWGGFDVSGIVVPSWLPALLSMAQDNLGGENFPAGVNQMAITGNCINYPFLYDADHKYYDLAINQPQSLDLEVEDFSFENCSSVTFGYFYSRWRMKLEVTDTTKPAYVMYQGFIIAVFNYS